MLLTLVVLAGGSMAMLIAQAQIDLSGSGPVECAPRSGPVGPRGPAGPEGPVGPTGQQGTQGSTGYTGVAGETGDRGATGGPGPQGNVGPTVHSLAVCDDVEYYPCGGGFYSESQCSTICNGSTKVLGSALGPCDVRAESSACGAGWCGGGSQRGICCVCQI